MKTIEINIGTRLFSAHLDPIAGVDCIEEGLECPLLAAPHLPPVPHCHNLLAGDLGPALTSPSRS